MWKMILSTLLNLKLSSTFKEKYQNTILKHLDLV